MKTLLTALLALSILAPGISQACGDDNVTSEQAIEQALLRKVADKALTCVGNNATIETSIEIYAQYRCAGSPVYGVLKVDSMPGGSIRVSKITENDNGKLTVNISDFAEPEICTVK